MTGRPLTRRYPATGASPLVELADLPTPVMRAPALSEATGAEVWVKRDDLTSPVYGGNKVRKLEVLLGEAKAAGATDIVTFGAAGSNHALATAIHGRACGFAVHSMLVPQVNAGYVARNLAAGLAAGADLHHYADRARMLRGTARLLARLRADGRTPFVIPFGGTTASSSVGYVNAAMELADQVESGALPEPDLVFVALGSMGTAAGLALGMRLAGMRSRLVAVPILPAELAGLEALLAAIGACGEALHEADPGIPVLPWTGDELDVARGFLGEEYARFTPAGMEAIRVASADGITLDGTYTGKAASAMLARGRDGTIAGATVLFWNTYNSSAASFPIPGARPPRTPARFRDYFEGPVQELDREHA